MNILNITSPDVNNGLGCRVTVWVAGCSHHCPGCQNQRAWEYNQGKKLTDAIPHIINELKKEWIKGITFSGGDPLDQSDESLTELLELCKTIKKELPEKDIWIWAGDVFEELITNDIKKEILQICDVLVDGPFIIEKKNRHLAFRGSDNQRIIDLQETFKSLEVTEIEIC